MQYIFKDQTSDKVKTTIFYIVIGLLVAFPLFTNLDALTIRLWDEARNANNAVEMSVSGNFIVTTYDYAPDMWNTKPPFLIWMQVFFIKLLGFGSGELAVRLPSAIGAFLTCLAVFLLCVKYLKNKVLAVCTVLVLVTIERYVDLHGTRTGDFDALLTLFTTASLISFFCFMEKKDLRFLYLFFIALALGALTKGIVALLILPAVGIYTISQKQTINLLKNKHFYFGLCVFIIPVIGFYLLREHYNPGYIKAVQENELGGRYLSTIEGHKENFWFYYYNILHTDITAWYLFIPCGFLIGMFSKDERVKRVTVFSTVFIVTYFLIISTGKTRLGWYVIPIFPFVSILVGVFIDFIYKALENLNYFNNVFKYNIAPVLFLFLILITPYQKIVNSTYGSRELPEYVEFNELSYFLRDAIRTNKDMNNYNILFDDYRVFTINFYKKVLEGRKMKISYKDYKTLEPGDKVAVSQSHIIAYIKDNFDCEVTGSYRLVELIKIKQKKTLP